MKKTKTKPRIKSPSYALALRMLRRTPVVQPIITYRRVVKAAQKCGLTMPPVVFGRALRELRAAKQRTT